MDQFTVLDVFCTHSHWLSLKLSHAQGNDWLMLRSKLPGIQICLNLWLSPTSHRWNCAAARPKKYIFFLKFSSYLKLISLSITDQDHTSPAIFLFIFFGLRVESAFNCAVVLPLKSRPFIDGVPYNPGLHIAQKLQFDIIISLSLFCILLAPQIYTSKHVKKFYICVNFCVICDNQKCI